MNMKKTTVLFIEAMGLAITPIKHMQSHVLLN